MAKGWTKSPDYDHQAFTHWVERARKQRGWGRAELSRQSGVNPGTLYQALDGRRLFSSDVRRSLITSLTDGGQTELIVSHFDLQLISAIDIVPVPTTPLLELHGRPLLAVAEDAAGRGEWIPAERAWSLAAEEARRNGDWATWATSRLGAATMAHHRGDLRSATRHLGEICKAVDQGLPISEAARIETMIRIGWGAYRIGRLNAARTNFSNARSRLDAWSPSTDSFERIVIHQVVRYCDGPTAKAELNHLATHLLGRTLIEFGLKPVKYKLSNARAEKLIRTGSDYLICAEHIERHQLGRGRWHSNQWLTELRRTIPTFREHGLAEARRQLNVAAELAHGFVTGDARVYLERFDLLIDDSPTQALDALERAHNAFRGPVVYVPGIASVAKRRVEYEQSSVASSTPESARRVLAQAVLAAMLHPYGDNLETLRDVYALASRHLTPAQLRELTVEPVRAFQLPSTDAQRELEAAEQSMSTGDWASHVMLAQFHVLNLADPFRTSDVPI